MSYYSIAIFVFTYYFVYMIVYFTKFLSLDLSAIQIVFGILTFILCMGSFLLDLLFLVPFLANPSKQLLLLTNECNPQALIESMEPVYFKLKSGRIIFITSTLYELEVKYMLAFGYLENAEFDKALTIMEDVCSNINIVKGSYRKILYYSLLSNIYINIQQIEKAKFYLMKAQKEYAISNSKTRSLCNDLLNTYQYYIDMICGKADEPLQYFSNRLQQSANALEHAHTYWILANLYRNEGNAEQEVDCLKKTITYGYRLYITEYAFKALQDKNIIVNPAAPLRYKNKINIVFYLICLACIIMMLIGCIPFFVL